ncbi:MAG: NAD(+) synthase [Lachnospiraceae bacterium]|nr:NAD(+) synthase [Lachnospiraceae bacterium]
MRDGFVKVAAVTPKIQVADVAGNVNRIIDNMSIASEEGAKIVVFPELSITGYSCGDLFYHKTLLQEALAGLKTIAKESGKYDAIFFVGLPYAYKGKLYNVAAAVCSGKILGFVPKMYMPNYAEFYEVRQFCPGFTNVININIDEKTEIPFGSNIIFTCKSMPELSISAEICEDLWVPCPPSVSHCVNGANIIVNLSASNEIVGKNSYRRELVSTQSARLYCGYIYASAGEGESTQDVVYSGHNIIAENGNVLSESALYRPGYIATEIDVEAIDVKRRNMNTFFSEDLSNKNYAQVQFEINVSETNLSRFVDKAPFVPSNNSILRSRCEEILDIQSMGLKKRLAHTNCKTAVIGISGGLDSTLALLVTTRAFDMLGLDREGIIAVTMPGFGTTDRTYNNAVKMIQELDVSFKEISIRDAVIQHFSDIKQDINKHDVTYENGQARERTQILMDIANKENGMVIGTGDMSELALGWATYNGDHMSMYGVNVSVPKTLVRHLVRYYADYQADEKLRDVLLDVLDTPVSPELLPPKDGEISQKTEDLVGPYELHDFFLYHLMRYGSNPSKIYRLAKLAFEEEYDNETILKWLKTFYRRFFSQQFKRSCLPDGPKVGTVSLSPRGDLRMPSDAVADIWINQIDMLEP